MIKFGCIIMVDLKTFTMMPLILWPTTAQI